MKKDLSPEGSLCGRICPQKDHYDGGHVPSLLFIAQVPLRTSSWVCSYLLTDSSCFLLWGHTAASAALNVGNKIL